MIINLLLIRKTLELCEECCLAFRAFMNELRNVPLVKKPFPISECETMGWIGTIHTGRRTTMNQRTIIYAVGTVVVVVLIIIFATN